MVEQEQALKDIIIASYKSPSIQGWKELLQDPQADIEFSGEDPELASGFRVPEPQASSPKEAVLFKLLQVLRYTNFYPDANDKEKSVLFELLTGGEEYRNNHYLNKVMKNVDKESRKIAERPNVPDGFTDYFVDAGFNKHFSKEKADSEVDEWAENRRRVEAAMIVASDVISRINGKVLHRKFRHTSGSFEDLPEKTKLDIKREVIEAYQDPLKAEWLVSYGIYQQGTIRITEPLVVSAQFSEGISEELVSKYFAPETSPGMRLLETARDLNIPLTISAKDGVVFPISYKDAYRLIVDKVPLNMDMIAAILQNKTQKSRGEIIKKKFKSVRLKKSQIENLLSQKAA